MLKIKLFRRLIIIICIAALVLTNINIFPKGKYYDNNIKELVSGKKARVIEVNKSIPIDKDKIIIQRIIIAEDLTYIRYRTRMDGMGWSFPFDTIKIYDDKKHLYNHDPAGVGGESSGKIWGEDGMISFGKLKKDARYLILKLDWYDRKGELKISLGKEGEASENK